MNSKEFKIEVVRILESNVKFEGHVNIVVNNLTEEKQNAILIWVNRCKLGETRPEPCRKFKNLIAFIYKSGDNRIRSILTKKKNSYFIELFLDKHKYYDKKRRYLGL